jgi:hypothetical protein
MIVLCAVQLSTMRFLKWCMFVVLRSGIKHRAILQDVEEACHKVASRHIRDSNIEDSLHNYS